MTSPRHKKTDSLVGVGAADKESSGGPFSEQDRFDQQFAAAQKRDRMKSVASSKSQSSRSVSSFLHRNFYTIKEQKDKERKLAVSNYKGHEADKRRVESARYGGASSMDIP